MGRRWKVWAGRFHRDTRGALGILLLLIVWALVLLIGLVWNSGEMATRRRQVQTGADAAAHASATWLARGLNGITALNMAICQDASAETIWRAVGEADKAVRGRLQSELGEITSRLANGDANYAAARQRMLDDLAAVDNEYAMTRRALDEIEAEAGGAAISDAQQKTQFLASIRQAGAALSWAQDTYVNGHAPAAGLPGTPGPNGEGLRMLVANWSSRTSTLAELQAVLAAIQQELAVVQSFEQRTQPAMAQDLPGQVTLHRQTLFAEEQKAAAGLPEAIEGQRGPMADVHQVKVTLALPRRASAEAGSASIAAPVMAAPREKIAHVDSIRMAFPLEAFDAFGTADPIVMIDPLNVHTDENQIWFPDVATTMPVDLQQQYPGIPATFTVRCNVPEGWGHLYCAPLERYVSERITLDQAQLRAYMTQMDDIREQLEQTLQQMRGYGSQSMIQPLPLQIADPAIDSTVQPVMIYMLPRIAPTNPASLRATIQIYNTHAAAYTGAIRRLTGALSNLANFYLEFTQPFAADTWDSHLRAARQTVLKALGQDGRFMVLRSYGLRSIPDWARPGMLANAQRRIYDAIIRMNLDAVGNQVANYFVQSNPRGMGGDILDAASRNQFLRAGYSQDVSQIAYAVVAQVAAEASPLIAMEWISRPWPYEITPPELAVPPTRGIGRDDRLRYYTLLAGAMTTEASTPRLLLPKVFGDGRALVAYAQAEAFNWMEFNSRYGAADRYDEVTMLPEEGLWYYTPFIGTPRCWRLSSPGGWRWQPRLSYADALGEAFANNLEFRQDYLSQTPLSATTDAATLEQLNVH